MLNLDLNLLGVFDALYDLRSVTRTAQRLNLTQSAVSHALRRLRLAVGDPLFLRAGNILQPTARAMEMAPAVREGLARLREAMLPGAFDPRSAARTFTIAAGSYFCAQLIPRLLSDILVTAPGIRFRIVPVGDAVLRELDEGAIDMVLGAFSWLPPRLSLELLFNEALVWIAAAHNPIVGRGLRHRALMAEPHLAIDPGRTFAPMRPMPAEATLESRLPVAIAVPSELQGSDSTPASVYDALTAIAVVAKSALVALVPRGLVAGEENRLGIRILDADAEGPGIDLVMATRANAADDLGLQWLRGRIAALAH